MTSTITVPVGDLGTTSLALATSTTSNSRGTLVIGHSSSGNMNYKTTLLLQDAMLAQGFNIARFNFLYAERKSGPPDRMPKLIECYSAVANRVRAEMPVGPLFLGGHSMGGRVATMMAADGYPADGLILFAYPLHPSGQLDKLRDEHLRSIICPVLCMNGTKDDLCNRELMDSVVSRLPETFTMHWLEGADHSFHMLKRSGRTEEDVYREIAETSSAWFDRRAAGCV